MFRLVPHPREPANMPDHPQPETPPQALPAFAPVPRRRTRHDGWTPERQRRFVDALADLGTVSAAAHAVGMTPESAYLLRRHPEAEEFRQAWQAALALGVQRLEDIAMERALNGVQVPVYAYGNVIGTRTVYNDALLSGTSAVRSPSPMPSSISPATAPASSSSSTAASTLPKSMLRVHVAMGWISDDLRYACNGEIALTAGFDRFVVNDS